jgi:hypothetical protein
MAIEANVPMAIKADQRLEVDVRNTASIIRNIITLSRIVIN